MFMTDTVTLKNLTLVPGSSWVYKDSKLTPNQTISTESFLTRYADRPHTIKYSSTGNKRKWKSVTAYGYGLDCWWIVV